MLQRRPPAPQQVRRHISPAHKVLDTFRSQPGCRLDPLLLRLMPPPPPQVPTSCPRVPDVLLQPALQWAAQADFNDTLAQLASLFVASFNSYLEDAALHVGADMAERILSGGPSLDEIKAVEAAAAAAEVERLEHVEVRAAQLVGGGEEADLDSEPLAEGVLHECKVCAARQSAEAELSPTGVA
eukprot:GHRQ01021174.1.p1 GENE.GHRQ01021174.1~~GHRQ01021174.1.p1  ORF type:complete len:184 (-),score=52.75 GHRQ01021174.1:214-765(-)